MEQNVKGYQTVNIFVASSGELKEEREKFIEVVNSINKVIKPLYLEVVRWETDLESGSYKKKKIQKAIDPLLEKSHIVFVLVYSKIGEFTLEEYNFAIEKEKKVFLYFKKGFSPQNIDETENYKKVLEFRNRVDKENETLYRDYKTIDQFKIFIREDLELYLKEEPPQPQLPSKKDDKIQKYLTPKPAKTIDLIGREEELNDIAHALEQSDRVLLVNGLGGVGKTELCKRYFWDHIDNYMHLAWVDVVGNIKESFVSAFNIKGFGFKEGDSMDERFEKIMDFLNGLDKHSLLVVDNIENPEDEDLDTIRALPFKVIANSRLNFEGFETHTLDFLSPKKCKDLFYTHYRGKRDDTYVDKIVERCGRHTLSVELLARTAQNAALSIKSLYEKLETRGFNLNDVIGDKVHTFWRNEKKRKRFFNHLLKIFDLSDVTKGELHILTNLSVLPPIYIPIVDFCEWMELKTKEDIHSLVFKGWLKQEGFNIFMHQVIQEVIRYKTSPDAKKCKNLIASLATCLRLNPGDNPITKKEYVIFAETLLQYIDENDKDLATLSNNCSTIYLAMGSLENASVFQLRALRIRERLFDKNHLDLAESYNNLAEIYRTGGKPEKALEYQLKDVEISEEVLDKNHPSLATSYNNLALVYKDLKDYKSAVQYEKKAVAILQKVFPDGHPNLDVMRRNLDGILEYLKRERRRSA